ncbi:OprD family outer membrane porin [Marinobacterium sp. YM272]|uniref:OprD family outer membrane porin n=1 Tax=Marinobacterium sp. YM272 TaxID=3421654 RepID=UPI003D800171
MNNGFKKLALAVSAYGFVMAPAFAEDSDLSLTLRTHFGQVDRDFGPGDSEEFSQALRLDYRSGYYNDLVGFDGSFYSIFKLAASGNTARIPLLDENGDGFTKIGQANLKFKLGDQTTLRAGRMRIISPLLMDTDGRSEPSTREAIHLKSNLGGLGLYGIYSEKVSPSGTDTYYRYTDSGDGVAIVGGKYRFDNGLRFHLAHGQLKDAKQQTFLNAGYGFPVGNSKLLLDFYHYAAEEIGDASNLKDNPGPDGELDTYLTNLAASLKQGDLTYTLSYQTVGDDLYEPSWDGFSRDTTVLWSTNSVQILDFYNPNQDSWQFKVNYDSSAIPGLSMMTRYTEGKYDGVKDTELDVEAKYVIQTGKAQGLSFQLRYADVDIGGVGELDDLRLIAQYKMSIF